LFERELRKLQKPGMHDIDFIVYFCDVSLVIVIFCSKMQLVSVYVCMCIGQDAEMVRQKLEKVNITGDMQAFISACGTGSEKPGSDLAAIS